MSIYWRCSLRVYWLPILVLCFVQASGASQRCPAGAVLVGVMSPIQATINAMVSRALRTAARSLLAATLCQDIELLLLILSLG